MDEYEESAAYTGPSPDDDVKKCGEEDDSDNENNDNSNSNVNNINYRYKSHFRNTESFPLHLRMGIPIFLFSTFVLLLCADIGSGVTADSLMMENGNVIEKNTILNVSVISSVGKLWEAESYPLAIFIAITSIGWPYIKLALATYSWMMPYCNPRRRERLIEIIDALGKWSFVDIMVIVEIMVAFRSTVNMGFGLSLEIVLVAQWGFYGFVVATMMSLLSTHIILHYHRHLHYNKHHDDELDACNNNNVESTKLEAGDNAKIISEGEHNFEECNNNNNNNNESANDNTSSNSDDSSNNEGGRGMKLLGRLSTGYLIAAVVSILVSMILYLAGTIVKSFEVTSTRGTDSESIQYSITSIGLDVPGAYIDSTHAGTRFIQAMWYFLGVLMPLWCSFLLLILYTVPGLSKSRMELIFSMAEVAFAWSCAEVLLLSTIFAVLQMPVFGAKLVENNCTTCFVITTRILPNFALLCVGTILSVTVNVWLYRKAHGVIFS